MSQIITPLTGTTLQKYITTLQKIPDLNNMSSKMITALLKNAILIKSYDKSTELEEVRKVIAQQNSIFLSLANSGEELFIPTILIQGSLSYCAPGFKKSDGIMLFEMHAPYFAVDHQTPIKRYPDDYAVFLSANSEIIILSPFAFEEVAELCISLYQYGLKEKSRLTTTMALSYSALMAPTALLRIARWIRFCAGQKISQGQPPVIADNSQETIGRFLGISRTTLAGAMRVLREAGAIDTRYRKISVNIEKLNEAITCIVNETPEDSLLS